MSLEPGEQDIFARWLSILDQTGIPYLVGGAFAIHKYTGIWRFTKDLDVFVRPADLKTALDALFEEGFQVEVTDPYWLAKSVSGSYLLDLIFSVANGYIEIDEKWFASANHEVIAGVRVPVMAAEELIASKTYVTRSDRFDGADIVHVVRSLEGKLKWDRLIQILKEDVVLLLWHLLLFDYVYPGHATHLPQQLMADLFAKAQRGWSQEKDPRAFYGMMIDPGRFEVDVMDWGYIDERKPSGPLVSKKGELL
jgi:hypothetical protein